MIMGIFAVAAADDVVIANPTLQPTIDWAVLILGASFQTALGRGSRRR
jgi:hypothetical protein